MTFWTESKGETSFVVRFNDGPYIFKGCAVSGDLPASELALVSGTVSRSYEHASGIGFSWRKMLYR